MNEQAIADHYSQAELGRKNLNALMTLGADLERLDPDQLAMVDEFHIGGRKATVELLDQLTYTQCCACSMSAAGWAAPLATWRDSPTSR